MTNRTANESIDDLPTELRKALVESGAVIPTSPEEVVLAEKHFRIKTVPSEIDAAFNKLEEAFNNPDDDLSFIKLSTSFMTLKNEDLAMAARSGTEIDDETRAKIEETIKKVLQMPRQDTSK
jgi:hypothetical protein